MRTASGERRTASVAAMLLALMGCGGTTPLSVDHLEVRIAPAGAVTASGYFVLHNRIAVADTLDRVTTPAADSVTIHESMDHGDGVMMMMPLTWVAVPARDSVVFATGGRHLMLEHFPTPMTVGSTVTLTFHFRSGRTIAQSVTVRAVGGEE